MRNDHIYSHALRGRRLEMEDVVFASPLASCEHAIANDLKSAFAAAHDATKDRIDGSTATVCYYHAQSHTITTAQLGDSRGFVFYADGDRLKANLLAKIHLPSDPREQKYIQQNGGIVEDRLLCQKNNNKSLAMSRAFGDCDIMGVNPNPTIETFECASLCLPFYMAVMSDGFFDSGREKISRYLRVLLTQGWNEHIAKNLTQHAYDNLSRDNISCGIAKIDSALDHDIIMGVFDGHHGKETAHIVRDVIQGYFLSR